MRARFFVIAGIASLLALALAVWFGWQIRVLGRSSVLLPSSTPFSPSFSPPLPTASAAPAVASLPVLSPEHPTASEENPAMREETPEEASDIPTTSAMPAAMPAVREIAESALEVRRETFGERDDFVPEQALREAAAALGRHDLAAARAHFMRLRAHDPEHLEALLGLADLALRQGAAEEAGELYRLALAAHPQDARAETGALALIVQAENLPPGLPEKLERRLRRLIAERPQAAAPHFVLGNLFARQDRWQEAQAAYFEASRREADNPDYRFNLAVSLDALRQSPQAAEQYRAALAAAERSPCAFDREEARARLAALLPTLPTPPASSPPESAP